MVLDSTTVRRRAVRQSLGALVVVAQAAHLGSRHADESGEQTVGLKPRDGVSREGLVDAVMTPQAEMTWQPAVTAGGVLKELRKRGGIVGMQ